jgi:hypothetical protein
LSPRALHVLAQDGIPWRGLGLVVLSIGGVIFLLLLGIFIGIRWVISIFGTREKGDPWL